MTTQAEAVLAGTIAAIVLVPVVRFVWKRLAPGSSAIHLTSKARRRSAAISEALVAAFMPRVVGLSEGLRKRTAPVRGRNCDRNRSWCAVLVGVTKDPAWVVNRLLQSRGPTSNRGTGSASEAFVWWPLWRPLLQSFVRWSVICTAREPALAAFQMRLDRQRGRFHPARGL